MAEKSVQIHAPRGRLLHVWQLIYRTKSWWVQLHGACGVTRPSKTSLQASSVYIVLIYCTKYSLGRRCLHHATKFSMFYPSFHALIAWVHHRLLVGPLLAPALPGERPPFMLPCVTRRLTSFSWSMLMTRTRSSNGSSSCTLTSSKMYKYSPFTLTTCQPIQVPCQFKLLAWFGTTPSRISLAPWLHQLSSPRPRRWLWQCRNRLVQHSRRPFLEK